MPFLKNKILLLVFYLLRASALADDVVEKPNREIVVTECLLQLRSGKILKRNFDAKIIDVNFVYMNKRYGISFKLKETISSFLLSEKIQLEEDDVILLVFKFGGDQKIREEFLIEKEITDVDNFMLLGVDPEIVFLIKNFFDSKGGVK